MAIVVKYDENGSPYFRSAKGIGSTVQEREKAKRLDRLIKKEIAKLVKRLKNEVKIKKNTKGNSEFYWEIGNIMREIFFDSGLVEATEKNLFFINVQLHCPKIFLAKDRGPNRLHLEYCFRLAGFSKEKAVKMNWGEWVYLFDSPGINREQRFDSWWNKKMSEEPLKFTRNNVRIFAQCVNNLTKKLETNDLADEQLIRCYVACWLLKERYLSKVYEIKNEQLKEMIKREIIRNYRKLGEVIEGVLSPEEFSSLFSL